MTKDAQWLGTVAKIRTVGFLAAMVPILLSLAVLALLILLLLTPQVMYERILGKRPRRRWQNCQVPGYWSRAGSPCPSSEEPSSGLPLVLPAHTNAPSKWQDRGPWVPVDIRSDMSHAERDNEP